MRVTDVAIIKIRDLIADGTLSPGDRLPPEQELATQLGISRSSLREAVKALSQARVLDVRRGDGTYVTSLEPELLMSGLSFVIDLMQDQTLIEVFEVRKLLEPAATALAARMISDDQIAELSTSLEQMRQAHTPEDLVVRDIEFHNQVVAATGNATLCSLVDAVSVRSLRARIWRASMSGLKSLTLSQHSLILDALRRHDPSLARSAATIHVSQSEQWLRQYLESAHIARRSGAATPLLQLGGPEGVGGSGR
ncbi:MAG TPA: FadR/GntR family transcriptional regulator [Mycobacteriales bacterium]|jgi:Transcriptional regulators